MGSIEAAVRSVFGGRGAEAPPFPTFSKPWPLFHLVPSHHQEQPGEELSSIVEAEIIPRLFVAHRQPAAEPQRLREFRDNREKPKVSDVAETLARLALSRHADLLEHFFHEFVGEGVSSGAIYAELLGPTGRFLIDLWSNDKISYSEVTIALGRLQRLVRELPTETPYNGEDDPNCRSALFATLPGLRQTFGFYIMEEQFRWAGWRTWTEAAANSEDMTSVVRSNWCDLFCLSVARGAPIGDISDSISAVRRASRNRDLFVLITDSSSAEAATLPDLVGADAAVANGDEAMDIMDRAMRRHAA